ncbi:MAG: hypothetical protein NDI94_01915 [Candidatus Woesearchaeota archaeon]|nr:hypothetical protein [Candidatus Woesearchaeota archaeon]
MTYLALAKADNPLDLKKKLAVIVSPDIMGLSFIIGTLPICISWAAERFPGHDYLVELCRSNANEYILYQKLKDDFQDVDVSARNNMDLGTQVYRMHKSDIFHGEINHLVGLYERIISHHQ